MRGSWPVGGLVALLVGCVPAASRTAADLAPQTELEREVFAAGLEAWRAAGFETTPAVRWLAQLRIEHPATLEAYEQACPPEALGRSWACLRWHDWDVPVAVVSPLLQTEEQLERAALHEECHAMGYRFGRWPDYNPGHTDEAVWAGKGGSRPNSVEQRAQRALER